MNNSSETSSLLFPNYEYRKLFSKFSTNELNKFKTSIQEQFQKIIWNDETYSEWKARTYFSIKMCLSATIMLSSLYYSMDKNLKVVEPYLLYYSLLNSSRAFLSLNPNENWNNGEMLKNSHSKIINSSASYAQLLNKEFSTNFKRDFLSLRDYRESFSYKFPSDGLGIFKGVSNIGMVEEYCIILLEITQYSSEILSKVFLKKNQNYNDYKFLNKYYDKFCLVDFYDETH
ncbi:MAG: hypothetical protein EOM55_02640, partial [Clostridia bacterium]|nr:hypothetical protein [Clostridia bacterium]